MKTALEDQDEKRLRVSRNRKLSAALLVVALSFALSSIFGARSSASDSRASKAGYLADPFMGDWQGGFVQKGQKQPQPLVAQVVALGKGRYHAALLREFDTRTSPIASLEGRREGNVVRFAGWGDVSDYCGPDWEGVADGDTFRGSVPGRQGGAFTLKKITRLSPTMGATAPAGAVVLFDGTNFDEWQTPPRLARLKSIFGKARTKGQKAPAPSAQPPSPKKQEPPTPGPVKWLIVDDAMRCTSGGRTIATKKQFTAFRLHLEFRTPLMPEAREQGRGNSGVLFHGVEIQVLDSYGLGGRWKECGALYGRQAPLVNACAPPTQWQTYDATVEPTDKEGKARLTVLHNGVKTHDSFEIGPISAPTSIQLQDHGCPVEYRNIWLVELR